MNFLKTKKLLIFISALAIFSAIAGFFIFKPDKNINIARAGIGDKLSGFAWNDNVGWISFNSTDCDTDNNGFIDTDAMVLGCGGTNALPDTAFDYGVDLNTIAGATYGNFSKYAYNDNVGWISFGETAGTGLAPNYDFNANCNAGTTCDDTTDCIACFNSGDNKIYGWAKILSMGDDGWIKFSHAGATGIPLPIAFVDFTFPMFFATPDYDLIYDGSSELSGWGLNSNDDNTGVGWISFNSSDCDSEPNGFVDINCGGDNVSDVVVDYSVKMTLNNLPSITGMTAPNWPPAQACGTALRAYLKWTYNDADDPVPGDKMSAYRIIVVNETDGGVKLDTGKCIKQHDGDNSCCVAGDADCLDQPEDCKIDIVGIGFGTGGIPSYELNSDVLDYNKNYSWSVEVWDSNDSSAGSVSYNNNTGADTDGDPDVDSSTFTTFVSKFPNPDNFIWIPKSFSAGEDVLFESMDRAKYYIGDTEHDCDESKCSWDWTDVDNNIEPITDASSTIMIFSAYGIPSKVELKVTDTTTSYSCSSTTDAFIIKQKLPSWIEAK